MTSQHLKWGGCAISLGDFCFYPSLIYLSKTRHHRRLILLLCSGHHMISQHLKWGCCAISLRDFGFYPFLIYLSKTRHHRRLILLLCSGHHVISHHLKWGCCAINLVVSFAFFCFFNNWSHT